MTQIEALEHFIKTEVGKYSCWEWQGTTINGYAVITADGRTVRAARKSYEILFGDIPTGLEIDHLCHTFDIECPGGIPCPHRLCVNPFHLEPVTHSQNSHRARVRREVKKMASPSPDPPGTIELAKDLKFLVGYGATPERVATLPTLRDLGIDGLRFAISRITETQELPGFAQTFTAEQIQAALNMLLGFDSEARRRRYLAPRRREEAIRLLGLGRMTVETWRRPNGPEFELMVLLSRMFGPDADRRELIRQFREAGAEFARLLAEREAWKQRIHETIAKVAAGQLPDEELEHVRDEYEAYMVPVRPRLAQLQEFFESVE